MACMALHDCLMILGNIDLSGAGRFDTLNHGSHIFECTFYRLVHNSDSHLMVRISSVRTLYPPHVNSSIASEPEPVCASLLAFAKWSDISNGLTYLEDRQVRISAFHSQIAAWPFPSQGHRAACEHLTIRLRKAL